MPGIIRYNRIYDKVLSARNVQNRAEKIVGLKFEKAKAAMLKDYEEDKITQELRNPAGGNISNTLDGKDNKSLFGFIGFDSGDDPAERVKEMLEKGTFVDTIRQYRGPEFNRVLFRIKYPSLQELYAATPMNWESGRSWLYGIERGISGFSNFLAGIFKSPKPSRSAQGIQLEEPIREASFKPRRYISKILQDFKERVRGM